jgi:D-tyrosyl-tRNA(Tyr) deacylase
MRIVVQRINNGSVSNDEETRTVNKGLCLLVGFQKGDTSERLDYMVDKIVNLRIFSDNLGNLNLSILDIKGEVLSISQFTLYADATKGRRPSFDKALESDQAKDLYELFNQKLKERIPTVEGFFKEHMTIRLENDGPVTIILES